MSKSQQASTGFIALSESFSQVRQQSVELCEPLLVEDYVVQTMPDVSPPKWHLAHVSWFYETFILTPYLKDYRPFNPQFNDLFNSYYQGVGKPFPRAQRGFLSRPSVAEVYGYRAHIDGHMSELIASLDCHRDSLKNSGIDPARPESRTAASGIVDDRYQAYFGKQPFASGIHQ